MNRDRPANPSVAVIVPVHNDAHTLWACLLAVAEDVRRPGWELIVVDDASADGSAALAEKFGARIIRLRENAGVAPARNAGARATAADILIFIDADIVPLPGTLTAMVESLRLRPEVHAVGAYPAPGDLSPQWSAHFVGCRSTWGYHWREGEQERSFSSIQSECGAIRRSTFAAMGGFSEQYKGVGMEEFQMSHEMERRGYGHLLLRAAAYRHHYKTIFHRCLALLDRTARWVPLVVRRKKFESRGAVGTPDAALSVLLTFLILAGLAAGFFWSSLRLVAAAAFLIQIAVELPFLLFASRFYGWPMFVYACFGLQLLNLAIGLGFLRGLGRCFRGGRDVPDRGPSRAREAGEKSGR
jgi:GT2 family glycosyltransferase